MQRRPLYLATDVDGNRVSSGPYRSNVNGYRPIKKPGPVRFP